MLINSLALYVGIFYSAMTILAIATAKETKDLLLAILVLLPPALLGFVTFMRF